MFVRCRCSTAAPAMAVQSCLRKKCKKVVDNRCLCWYNKPRRQARTSGGLAQLGERLHGMQEVTGSIPVFSTRKKSTAQKCVVLFCCHERVRKFTQPGERRAWTARVHRDWNGPGIPHQIKSVVQKCTALFCLSQTSEGLAQPGERRTWTARVHRDLKRPGILHQNKASHIVWCLFCLSQTSEESAQPEERRADIRACR